MFPHPQARAAADKRLTEEIPQVASGFRSKMWYNNCKTVIIPLIFMSLRFAVCAAASGDGR